MEKPKRVKTGGRQKKDRIEKFTRETFTVSPSNLSILEDQDNRSAYVNEAIKEKYEREGMKLYTIKVVHDITETLIKVFEGFTWKQAVAIGDYWNGQRPVGSDSSRVKLVCDFIDKCEHPAKLLVDDNTLGEQP